MNDVAFLTAVEARLARALDAGLRHPPGLAGAVSRLILAPGAKRLRPRLVQRLGEAVGAADGVLVPLATAGELIHSASLLHDDVVDEASQRRGVPTANAKHGNPRAVLAGDLVLSLAFVEVEDLPAEVTRAAVRVVAEMSRAALLEVDARADAALLGEDHRQLWEAIAVGKTGALFGWCAAAPALAVGAPRATARRLDRFGRVFGVAFQLADDLLDLRGRASDLANKQPTLPLLRACARDARVRGLARDVWAAPEPAADAVAALAAAVGATGALDEAADQVARILDEAAAALEDLAPAAEPVLAWTRLLRQSVGR